MTETGGSGGSRESLIRREMNAGNNSLKTLSDLVSALEKRLASILNPYVPEKSKENEPEAGILVPLAEEIHGMRSAINVEIMRMQNILERIEL